MATFNTTAFDKQKAKTFGLAKAKSKAPAKKKAAPIWGTKGKSATTAAPNKGTVPKNYKPSRTP